MYLRVFLVLLGRKRGLQPQMACSQGANGVSELSSKFLLRAFCGCPWYNQLKAQAFPITVTTP